MKRVFATIIALAMVLSMSVMTFAEGGYKDNVSLSQTVNEDGTVTVTISTSGLMESFDFGIIYKNAEVVECKYTTDFRVAYLGGSTVVNDVPDYGYVIFTGANADTEFNNFAGGAVGYVTFKATEDSTMQIAFDLASYKDGEHTTSGDEMAIIPAADPTQNPDPVDPTQNPDPVDPTQNPDPVDPSQNPDATGTPDTTDGPAATDAPAGAATDKPSTSASNAPSTTATKAPTTTTTTATKAPTSSASKTSAAKTADVAPVAAMAVLALGAGVVVVAMKKKATI